MKKIDKTYSKNQLSNIQSSQENKSIKLINQTVNPNDKPSISNDKPQNQTKIINNVRKKQDQTIHSNIIGLLKKQIAGILKQQQKKNVCNKSNDKADDHNDNSVLDKKQGKMGIKQMRYRIFNIVEKAAKNEDFTEQPNMKLIQDNNERIFRESKMLKTNKINYKSNKNETVNKSYNDYKYTKPSHLKYQLTLIKQKISKQKQKRIATQPINPQKPNYSNTRNTPTYTYNDKKLSKYINQTTDQSRIQVFKSRPKIRSTPKLDNYSNIDQLRQIKQTKTIAVISKINKKQMNTNINTQIQLPKIKPKIQYTDNSQKMYNSLVNNSYHFINSKQNKSGYKSVLIESQQKQQKQIIKQTKIQKKIKVHRFKILY